MELLHVQSFQQDLLLLTLASVISFGVTEILKPFLKSAFKDKEKNRSLTRIFSIAAAAIVGYELGDCTQDTLVGASAGILNSWVIAVIKAKIEEKFHVKLKDQQAGGNTISELESDELKKQILEVELETSRQAPRDKAD